MKRLIAFPLVALLLLFIAGCTTNTNNGGPTVWQATVDGQQKSGSYYSCFYMVADKILILTLHQSAMNSVPYIQLSADNVSGTGTFSLDEFSDHHGSYVIANVTNSMDSKTGTLTITSFNATTKKVSGTFSFHGESVLTSPTSTVDITNGSFTDLTMVNQ